MERYLIDTNVISDYLSAALPDAGMLKIDAVIDAVPNLSIITQIELLCWKTTPVIELNIKNFIADSKIIHITPDVISGCVWLRKSKKIKTPDAIIAATAMANNLVLLTNNEKDFRNINGLKLLNPHML